MSNIYVKHSIVTRRVKIRYRYRTYNTGWYIKCKKLITMTVSTYIRTFKLTDIQCIIPKKLYTDVTTYVYIRYISYYMIIGCKPYMIEFEKK